MKRLTFQIDHRVDGKVERRGWAVNAVFAVHADPEREPSIWPWTLTHRPTGLAVGFFRTRAQANLTGLALTQLVGRDRWVFTAPSSPKRWPARVRAEAKALIDRVGTRRVGTR